MYTRLVRSGIRVELASPAYLGLGITKKIILPCINVRHAPVHAWNLNLPPTWAYELFKTLLCYV